MITREEWIRKAGAVGRFGSGAATSERGAYEGIPHLAEALREFTWGNFDDNHRKGILDIVTRWANHEAVELYDLVLDMREAHDKAKEEE